MKKFSFAIAADVLFYSAAAWIISVGILRYYRADTRVCMAAATLIALAVGCTLFLLLSTRRNRRLLGKKERERRDALLLHTARSKQPQRRFAEKLVAEVAEAVIS